MSLPRTLEASPCIADHEFPKRPEKPAATSSLVPCPNIPFELTIPDRFDFGASLEESARDGFVLGIGDAALELKGEPKGEVLRVLWPLPRFASSSSSSPDIKRRFRGLREEAAGVELVLEEVGFMALRALAVRVNVERHRIGDAGRQ